MPNSFGGYDMREEILRILYESAERYISGERISQMLGISRAAVWKHIQALQREGFVIEAVTHKGYRLTGADDVLHAALIGPMLTTRDLGRNIVCMPCVPSTNAAARALAAEGCAGGTVLTADSQTEGRGRRGRSWSNAPGKDIAMSIVLRPRLEPEFASRYTFATALGVYRLAEGLGLAPSIKWPNDVLLDGKKFCGILFEVAGEMDALHTVIAGIGLNVNSESFPEEIREIATSLRICLGRPLQRRHVIAALLNILEPLYDACADEAGYEALLRAYLSHCGTIGQRVTVTGIRETLGGTAEGVDELGRLLLRTDDGALHALLAGDVTLRGGARLT